MITGQLVVLGRASIGENLSRDKVGRLNGCY